MHGVNFTKDRKAAPISLYATERLACCSQAQLASVGSAARVLLHPTATHGGFLLDFGFQAKIIEEIKLILL